MHKALGAVNALYPMPTTLVGAHVDGRPNFLTIANVGIFTKGEPELISIGVNKAHYTNAGIRANKALSVCLPGEDLLEKTDCCGLASGKNADKAALFEVFYGRLKSAPLIRGCPVCMECELHDTYETLRHEVFVGRIVETWVEESVLREGAIDLTRVRPILFDMSRKKYFALGAAIGDCWKEGLALAKTLKAR